MPESYAVILSSSGIRSHVYPDGRRVVVGRGRDALTAAREDYVAGRIEVDELERRVERALKHAASGV